MTFISRRTGLAGLAVLGTSALVLAGCAAAPEDGGDGGEALDFLPCVVSGTGRFDDNSFNQLAYEGMIAAGEELGVEPITIESETQDDYAPNVQGAIDQGCDFIITVGFDLATGLGWAGGYVGTGVTATNLAGRTLADLVLRRDTDLTRLPWVDHRARRWEIEPLRWSAVNAIYSAYRGADRLESLGAERTSGLAKLADLIAGR